MALAIGFSLVVLSVQVDRHREFRLTLQHLRRMCSGRDTVAHLRESGGEKGMMGVVRPGDPGERFSSFGVFLRAVAGPPEVAPEALRVIRIEAHGLLDPVDAFFRPPKPRQKLSLLDDNQVVVGIEGECPFLVVHRPVMFFAIQAYCRQDSMYVAIVVVERERDFHLRGHLLERGVSILAPAINPRLTQNASLPRVSVSIVWIERNGSV